MANVELDNDNFQLNLLFKGEKNPYEAFEELKDIFQSLSFLDETYLASIDSGLRLDYSLQSLEYSSIKTWIAQRIREIPDEAIKDFDWQKLVGHFCLKLKYLVLKYLEKNSNIDSKDSLVELSKDIEAEKLKILKNENHIINEVNTYLLLNSIEKIISVLTKLKAEEKIEFKSIGGSVQLSNKYTINKAKILWELGDKTFENETTETLKIKKSDFLSNNSLWSFKLGNKALEAKITDQAWLDKYHKREYPLLPEDSLKVKLKVSYVNKPDGTIVKPTYEITKVIDIIYPDDNNQGSLLDEK